MTLFDTAPKRVPKLRFGFISFLFLVCCSERCSFVFKFLTYVLFDEGESLGTVGATVGWDEEGEVVGFGVQQ